jgi:VCBS repeat protein
MPSYRTLSIYRTLSMVLAVAFLLASTELAEAQRFDNTPPFDAASGGGFGTAPGIPLLLTGDLNGDGKPDVVLYGDAAYFSLGSGTAAYATWVPIAGAPGPGTAALADIDGDGLLDLVVAWAAGLDLNVSVLRGGVSGATFSFGAPTTTTKSESSPVEAVAALQILVGDLNGDNRPDLIIRELTVYPVGLFNTHLMELNLRWLNVGGAFPLSGAAYSGTVGPILGLADANGDGVLDVFVNGLSDTSVVLGEASAGARKLSRDSRPSVRERVPPPFGGKGCRRSNGPAMPESNSSGACGSTARAAWNARWSPLIPGRNLPTIDIKLI